jgi:phage terminase Nu1 subunit (DNA packaging protein)
MPSQAEVATHLDMQPRQVRELRDRNIIPDPREADLESIRVAYIRHLREQAAGRRGEGPDSIADARTRLAQARTRGEELKNAQLEGRLIEAGRVAATWSELVTTARNRLRALPRRAVTLIPGFTNAMARRLLGLIDEVLDELARGGQETEPESGGASARRRHRESA